MANGEDPPVPSLGMRGELMQLHDRDLELETVGDDVGLLQRELQTIGFPIDREELDRKVFGRSTHRAVAFLQELYADSLRELGWQGRPGIVERTTAMLIHRTHDRVLTRTETPPPIATEPEYRVSGGVRNAAGLPVIRATVTVSNQNVKGAERLGSAKTGETGAFEILFEFQPQDG